MFVVLGPGTSSDLTARAPVPPERVVEVVRADPRPAASLTHHLDDDERARLGRLQRAADRDAYATAHALLRVVAARWTGRPPQELDLRASCRRCGGPHGKLELHGPDPSLHVSLSHATGQVVVAVGRLGPLGVDVEEAAAVGFDGFESVALSADEQRALAALAPDEQPGWRATLWARKEAVLKATGHGLTKAPNEVEVSGPGAPPALAAWHGDADGRPPVIHLLDLDLGPGRAGSLAVIAEDRPEVRLLDGDQELGAD